MDCQDLGSCGPRPATGCRIKSGITGGARDDGVGKAAVGCGLYVLQSLGVWGEEAMASQASLRTNTLERVQLWKP